MPYYEILDKITLKDKLYLIELFKGDVIGFSENQIEYIIYLIEQDIDDHTHKEIE